MTVKRKKKKNKWKEFILVNAKQKKTFDNIQFITSAYSFCFKKSDTWHFCENNQH